MYCVFNVNEKEIMQGTMPGARRRGRPRTAWMDYLAPLKLRPYGAIQICLLLLLL